jgi:hypothetical protein
MNGCRLRSRHRERHQAIHAAEPEVSSAIEGGKIPGWVRYHYSRLAGSVDAMELYDLGDNVEIVRSLNPGLIMLLTSEDAGHSKSGALLSSKPMLGGFLPSAPAAIDAVHLDTIGRRENTVARLHKVEK